MAMTKIVSPDGWNFGQPSVTEIKISSRGLIGNDRSDFLKIASPVFLDLIDNLKVAKDEMPVHTIAMGATEFWGPNRNGDGFKEATCRKHHHTFEKYARWYRNHKNKDPKISYGYIKKSAYHEAMHRIELLAMLNAEKSAADRNGGFVADLELAKIARGDDIATSMACRVPFDVCSGCDNKARTRADYCTDKTCKYGGCRDNLTKVAEDGHILHVDNPDPLWFDESDVFRPADRTAYGAHASYLQKAAGALWTPGAKMAEELNVQAPLYICLAQDEAGWSDSVRGLMKLAYGLAFLERDAQILPTESYRAFDPAVQPEPTEGQLLALGRPGSEKSASALAALADAKIILPLRDFARWLGKSAEAAAAGRLLPGIFEQMIGSGRLEAQMLRNPFELGEKHASLQGRNVAQALNLSHSFDPQIMRDRVMISSLRTPSSINPKSGFWDVKHAADHADAAALAEQYALYKLATLHRVASFDRTFDLTARLAVGQNRVM